MKKCSWRTLFLHNKKNSSNLQSYSKLRLPKMWSYSELSILLVLVIILFCPTLFAQADSLQTTNFSGSGELTPLPDTLDKAIRLAEQKKNPDLFYNLGVEFFSRGEIGMANLYFLKALNINSAHSPARTNLELSIHYSPDADLYPESGLS